MDERASAPGPAEIETAFKDVVNAPARDTFRAPHFGPRRVPNEGRPTTNEKSGVLPALVPPADDDRRASGGGIRSQSAFLALEAGAAAVAAPLVPASLREP